MKKIIWIQLILGGVLILIFLLAYLGSLVDVKYVIEEASGIDNRVIETIYRIISKLSILFGLLASLVIVTAIILLIRDIR
ncbi:MAG: hypothetical protein WC868_12570 [Bacteroidales bacterium]